MHSPTIADPTAGEVLAPAMVAGTQFVADFGDCRCAHHLLDDAVALEATCVEAVRRSGLTAVATRFHQFQPGGATGMVLLAESHLAIHTWPESHFASIDLYVCNFNEDNTAKAEALLAGLKLAFLPALPSHQRVARGRVPRG